MRAETCLRKGVEHVDVPTDGLVTVQDMQHINHLHWVQLTNMLHVVFEAEQFLWSCDSSSPLSNEVTSSEGFGG